MSEQQNETKNAGQSRLTDRLERLRELAEKALWTGEWYNAGCNTVQCTYNEENEHGEIAHPEPLEICEYLSAVQPKTILELLDLIERHNSLIRGASHETK